MNELFTFIIQSWINLALLFLLYWLFLRTDTSYRMNRYYLLTSLIVSFLFPLLKIPWHGNSRSGLIYMLEPIVITPHTVAEHIQVNDSLVNFLLVVYLVGSGIFLIRLIHQFYKFLELVNRYGVKPYNGSKLVIHDQDYVPFSLFNLVFIRQNLINTPGFDKIIEHEKAHVRQLHTIDLILLEVLLIFQWVNPVIWLIRRSLRSIHEYLADRSVLEKGYDALEYRQLLLNQIFGVQYIKVSNNLNHSLTKKRFIMMSKKRTNGMSRIKMFLIIPAAMAIALAFTISITENVIATNQDLAVNDLPKTSVAEQIAATTPQEEPVFTVVEEMPKYPGGQEAMTKFMIENIKYPENARKNGIQGTVFITFLIEKDGTVSNARVLRGVEEEIDKEALRVVNAMPKWTPGKEKKKPVNVQFNLPIAFKLDADSQKNEIKKENPPRYQEVKKIDK